MGNDIIFGAAPANGASLFVTVIGSTVGIGTPSDNTVTTAILQNGSVTTAKITDANVTTAKIADSAVTSAKIADGTIVNSDIADNTIRSAKILNGTILNADINSSAAIAGTKISPDFGSQNIATTGTLATGDLTLTDVSPSITFTDSNDNPDFSIFANTGELKFKDDTSDTVRMKINSDGHVDVIGNLDVGAGVDVTGNITVSGTVDGVDIAALNTTVGNITTDVVSDTSPQLGGDLDTNGHEISLDDNHAIKFGDSNDFTIQHNTNENYIQSNSGHIYIRANVDDDEGDNIYIQPKSGENSAVFIHDGAVELYYDNAKRLETTSTGTSFPLGADWPDAQGARFGASNDLIIQHDGNNSKIHHGGAGGLKVTAGDFQVMKTDGSEFMARFLEDSRAELYFDGSKKLETTSAGATVTGTCTATAFSGDGSALTGIQGIPSGVIMLWSGATNAIPTGFVLCDGQNSTPDLRDRFVVGAGNSYNVGATGGSNTASDTINLSVSISGTTGGPNATELNRDNGGTFKYPASGSHTHSFSGSWTGSETVTIDTRSPYYALCYIMKT